MIILALITAGNCDVLSVSSGCGSELPLSPLPGESHKFYIDVEDPYMGKVNRTYVLHLPTHYPILNDKATPLVLDFHGTGGHAASHQFPGGLADVADEDINGGFIVVYPQGVGMEDPIDMIEGKGPKPSWNCSIPTGPLGPVCVLPRNKSHPWEKMPCFDACPNCDPYNSCYWTSCHDDIAFARTLIYHVMETFCIDTDSILCPVYLMEECFLTTQLPG